MGNAKTFLSILFLSFTLMEKSATQRREKKRKSEENEKIGNLCGTFH